MTLRDALLPLVDRIRGIPGALGLRRFTVEVYTRVWTGERPGVGSSYDTRKAVMVAHGAFTPKVVEVSSRDIIASGGRFTDADLRIGPITPEHCSDSSNNAAINVFDPPTGPQPMELLFKITGPGFEQGAWFKKIDDLTTKPFRYEFVVRATGELNE